MLWHPWAVVERSDLTVPADPVRGAQFPLEDLTAGITRQRVDDLDDARALVVREAVTGESDDVRPGRLVAAAEDDHGHDGLAPVVVGNADHRDLGHRRMPGHRLLDFG